jgi:hypothetical protein
VDEDTNASSVEEAVSHANTCAGIFFTESHEVSVDSEAE